MEPEIVLTPEGAAVLDAVLDPSTPFGKPVNFKPRELAEFAENHQPPQSWYEEDMTDLY